MCDEKMIDICLKHHALFAKGIGLEYFPGVQEALDGIVPLRLAIEIRTFSCIHSQIMHKNLLNSHLS